MLKLLPVLTWLAILSVCVLSGILGRMGGSGNYPRQMRVIGIPLLSTFLAFLVGICSPWLIVFFGLLCASISTYWDFCPWNKGEDNFFQHGFFIGLSFFPLAIVTGHFWQFSVVVALFTAWMGLWSKILTWDVGEEFTRYFIVPVGILFFI